MCTVNSKTKDKTFHKQRGFTLIEMAIVISIVGLVIASAGTAYVQWKKWQSHEVTKTNIALAQNAIEGFLATNGRYPCPASLSAQAKDVAGGAGLANAENYGLEPSIAGFTCNDVMLPAPQDMDADGGIDFFITAGARTPPAGYIDNAGNAVAGVAPNVRIGAIPYRSLGIDESIAYDGYRNRLYYAVTDHMTSNAGFDNGTTGAIDIVDDAGATYASTAGNIHFTVFSAGENGVGAFTREGLQTPCPLGSENENCDLDSTFMIGTHSTSNDGANMDDMVTFGYVEVPYFERPAGGDLDDGVTKSAAALGLGSVRDNPTEELDIAGIIRVQDDPLTTGPTENEGLLEAQELCANGSDADCFRVEVIAGNLSDGEGMQCGAGTFIIGIENNSPRCGIIETGCSGSAVITGIDADGNATCSSSNIDASCPSQQVTLCSETKTLAFGAHGTRRTVTAGTNTGNLRRQTFRCNNGTWVPNRARGMCECTPSVINVRDVSCAQPSRCGDRFTGTRTVNYQSVSCPSGGSSTTNVNTSSCACDTSAPPKYNSGSRCTNTSHLNRMPSALRPPSGYRFTKGNITRVTELQCPSGTCTPWAYHSNTCGCDNGTPTVTRSRCTNGFDGDVLTTRQFTCTGNYGRDVTSPPDTSGCTCDTSTVVNSIKACDQAIPTWVPKSGHSGVRIETRKVVVTDASGARSCVSQETALDKPEDVCEPPPAAQYGWNRSNNIIPGGGAHATRIHGIPGGCSAGDPPRSCSEGNTLYSQCRCERM